MTDTVREDVVQIVNAPLEAFAVIIIEVCGCTPHSCLTDGTVTTRYLQR